MVEMLCKLLLLPVIKSHIQKEFIAYKRLQSRKPLRNSANLRQILQ